MYQLKTKKERFNSAIFGLKFYLDNYTIPHAKNLLFRIEDHTTNSFVQFKKEIKETGYLTISKEGCNKSIFDDARYNILFRYWHDVIHYETNLNFSLDHEIKVCNIQIKEISKFLDINGYSACMIEDIKEIIYHEIISQGLFYKSNNNFIDNQKKFIYDLFLSDGYHASKKDKNNLFILEDKSKNIEVDNKFLEMISC